MTKLIEHPKTGELKSMSEWAKHTDITTAAMAKRIMKWPLEKALSLSRRVFFKTFENRKPERCELIAVRRKTKMTQKQVADILDIGYSSYVRMESGARPVKKTVLFALKYIRNSLKQRDVVKNNYDKNK